MLLEKITICDWRCFYGEQLIEFASKTDKNVTLIHAENGVGKTSLLNALLWCFYKKTTARFEKPDDILNHQAKREGKTKAEIAVEFSHEDSLYEARRIYRSNAPESQNKVIVSKINFDGKEQTIREDPKLFLNSVLPEEMAGHFLFDGEHAEALTSKSSAIRVSKAIKDILGCNFVEQTISSLDKIETSYRRQASASNTENQVDQLETEFTKFSKRVSKLKEEIEDLTLSIENNENERVSTENTLSNFADIKQAQITKKDLTSSIERAKKYEQGTIAAQQVWVAQNATYCLGNSLSNQAKGIIDRHNIKMKENTKFSKEVILKILDLGECVCGTCIENEVQLQSNLRAQLETAETQELQARLSKVGMLTRKLGQFSAEEKLGSYETEASNQQEHFQTIKDAEIRLGEINKTLENADDAGISSLQKRSSELYSDIQVLQRKKGEVSVSLKAAEHKLSNLKSQLDNLNQTSVGGQRHLQNQRLSKMVLTTLSTKLNTDLEEARNIINRFVRKIIEDTARKNFKVIVDKSFSVKLMDEWGNDMAKSEGENQLLGLAFTAALAKFAKIRKNAKSKLLLPGTEAPLVLDAPFGKLDPVYKHATADFLPKMASQVIVMVNREQGSPKVLEILKDKIGFQYALVRHNTGPRNGKNKEELNVNGKTIEITEYESIFDGTGIELI